MLCARHLGSLIAACVCVLFARSAESAEPGPPEAALRYEASGSGCPSADAYRAEARKRVPARTNRARTLRVRLGPSRHGFEGTVEAVELRAGSPRVVASRTLEGATCEEVADATLLLVALGVIEASPPVEVAPPPPPPPPPPPEVPPSRSALQPTFQVAGLAVVAAGLGSVAVGGGGRVGVGLERAGLFRPELRLGVDVIASARLQNAIGTAERSLVVARADLCPVALGRRPLSLRVCAAGAIGEVRVRGEAVAAPRDEGRLYTALGGLVRGNVRIVGGLGAELSGGVLAPLVAHRFFFEPDTTVLRLDSPVPFVEGGLTWSIP